MKIAFAFRGLERSSSLVDMATRRLEKELRRFGASIHNVDVQIGDVNGPKGGEDKYCRINVSIPTLASVSVSGSAPDAYQAVHLAVVRLGRALGNRLGRRRDRTGSRDSSRGELLAS